MHSPREWSEPFAPRDTFLLLGYVARKRSCRNAIDQHAIETIGMGNQLLRMSLRELFVLLLLALPVITLVLLLTDLTEFTVVHALTLQQIAAIIPYAALALLPRTVPAAALFAVCALYGRLRQDNELLAVEAGGVYPLHLIWPALLFGLMLSGGLLALYGGAVPAAEERIVSLIYQEAIDHPDELFYRMLRKDGQINLPDSEFALFAQRVEGRQLSGVVLKRRGSDPASTFTATARYGEIQIDRARERILLRLWPTEIVSGDGVRGSVRVFVQQLQMPAAPCLDPALRARYLSWHALQRRRQEVAAEQRDAPADRLGSLRQEATALDIELQARPAVSLGPLCFVLIGCPVGVRFGQGNYLGVFAACFLPIVFVYYPVLLGTIELVQSQSTPACCLWAADVVMVAGALFLLRPLAR
jgi:lipopolysaccharide export system permease protein